MYCINCGAHLPDNAKFCPNCGSAIGEEQPSKPTLPAKGSRSEKNKRDGKRGKKPLAVAIAAIALLLLIPFAKQILFGGATEDPMGSSDPLDPYEQVEKDDNPSPAGETDGDHTIVSIPDLEHYFGTQSLSEDDQTERFFFDIDPRDAVRNYVELLQSKYDVVLAESYEDDAVAEWVMHHKDDPDTSFSIAADRAGDGTWEVNCLLNSLTLQFDGEVWEWPNEDTPEPIPEPEPTVTDPAVLPDFLAHDSSGKFYLDEDESRVGKVNYQADSAQLNCVVEDYMGLLTEMGYTVVYEYDREYTTPSTIIKRDFYHSGVDAGAVLDDSEGQVRVHVGIYPKSNNTYVMIYYSDGITMENFSGGSGGGSGGSSSSGGSDIFVPEASRPDCLTCDGDGDCNKCGGYGTVKRYTSDGYIDSMCPTCRYSGNCTACGGTGKR